MNISYTLLALTQQISPGDIGIPDAVKNPNSALNGILNTVYAWAGILCVIIIIVGAYLYVTSNANAQRIKRAKDAIMYAAVGLIVVMMAFVITQFVIGKVV
jgi:hypothetical protein